MVSNILFKTDFGYAFLALRPIQKGEDIAFFSPSIEWKITEAFDCLCGSEQCLGRIQGAAFLDEEVLEDYRLSPHIKAKLEERTAV